MTAMRKILISVALGGLIAAGTVAPADAARHYRHHHKTCHHVHYGVWAPARITRASCPRHHPLFQETPIPRPPIVSEQ